MTTSLHNGWRAARRDPAFALYLLALATLGFKWVSPLPSFNERAIWSDVLIAAAAAVWLLTRLARRDLPRLRVFHLALGLYVAAGVLSLAFASDQSLGAKTILLMVELCALAFLTSEFASDPARLNAIVWTVVFVTLYTAVLAAVGLALFYAGTHTSLLNEYGAYLTGSSRYARISAGFYAAPLLGSFCIFASAVVAREDTTIPRWLRRVTQITLCALVLLTFSRAIIGFAAAFLIRAAWARPASRRLRVLCLGTVIASIFVIGALTAGRLEGDPTRPTTASYQFPAPHERAETVSTSFHTLTEHPLVGLGPGSLPGENRGLPFRAHLTPLDIAATMGLPALAAMAFLLLTLWRNRRRPTPIAAWSGLAGLGIDALGQDIEHFRHLWVLLGLADSERRGRR